MIRNEPTGLQPDSFRSLLLVVLTVGNYALMYLANIVLARSLTVHDFDDYSVALSIVTMLSTLATLGLEKYALRAIVLFHERQDWQKFQGFWRFSVRTIFGSSLLLFSLLSIGLETLLTIRHADYHISIVLYSAFLPVIALTLLLVEVLSAQGSHLLGIAIYRLFMPLVFLLLLSGLSKANVGLSATAAVLCLGFSWTTALVTIWAAAKKLMPIAARQATPVIHSKKWLSRSLPLVFNSLMMTVMTSSGVVILELLYPSGTEVGSYAIAAQTGGFISLIGTSTNRYYLPRMVVLVEHHNMEAIMQLISQRTLVIGSLIIALLASFALFGQRLLDLFGNHFTQAYLPLVIISVGASFSALYADMPYYLQFLGFNRLVLSTTLIAMLTMLILAFVLGNQYGNTGVACAYMMPVVLLFMGFRLMVALLFKRN